MKDNLKINILWLLLLLAGYGLISALVSAGVLNLFYIQILQQIVVNNRVFRIAVLNKTLLSK